MNPVTTLLTLSSVCLLTACGGSSGSSGSGQGTATLSMKITDAPVSNATALVLWVDSIELKHGSTTLSYEVNQSFDLLSLQGSNAVDLFADQEVPAGDYEWMRLYIDIDQSSLTTSDGGVHGLTIPSNEQTGLKINTPFSLPVNSSPTFIIDFDVAKSLTLANGDYKLRPTLRLIDGDEAGHISGTVSPVLMADCAVPVVYAFAGEGMAFAELDSNAGPVTTSLVTLDETSGDYTYTLGFLLNGGYQLYLACDADDPEADDDIEPVATVAATVNGGLDDGLVHADLDADTAISAL